MFTIPNIITILNLLCGCLGFIAIWEGKQPLASYLIIAGAFFDFLDGFVARLMKSYSDIGKQLDSLADAVTFGALPALLMFDMMRRTTSDRWATLGLFLAIFAVLRLAKFNIDTRQKDSFIGLPTPAMAIAVASLPLIVYYYPFWRVILDYNFLLIYTFLLSWAMISEIPLLSFKFKNHDWENNQARYSFFMIAGMFLILLNILAVPILIIAYILWSIFFQEDTIPEPENIKQISPALVPEDTSTDPEEILP